MRARLGWLLSAGCVVVGCDVISGLGSIEPNPGSGTTTSSTTDGTGGVLWTTSSSPSGGEGGQSCDCVDALACPGDSDCRNPTCADCACGLESEPPGTPCDDDGGELCDGQGQCVAGGCVDNVKDGAETDVDCGGGQCMPCDVGQACLDPADCKTKFCAKDGTCGKCSVDGDCAADEFCNSAGNCRDKLTDGASCGGPNECKSGHCADKVCCDSPCSGACDACNTVNAKGKCTLLDGEPGDPSCSPYLCDGATAGCPKGCTDDKGCVVAGYCGVKDKKCYPVKLVNGTACAGNGECKSGYCVDGVCCAQMACAECQSCDVQNSVGTCAGDAGKDGQPCGNNKMCSNGSCP